MIASQVLLYPAKPPPPPPPKPQAPKRNVNSLFRFGYNVNSATRARHLALERAIDVMGYKVIYASLTYFAATTARSKPHFSHIYRQDRQWVYDTYRFA